MLTFTGGNNRMDGYTYDSLGNLLGDGTHSYTYDEENRLIKVDNGSAATYQYDAEGHRTRTPQFDILYDLQGHPMTFMSASSESFVRSEVYAGGRHVATYDAPSGTTYFTHADWLGNERVRSNVSNGQYSSWTNLPFGEGSSALNPGKTHFTGKERNLGETRRTIAAVQFHR